MTLSDETPRRACWHDGGACFPGIDCDIFGCQMVPREPDEASVMADVMERRQRIGERTDG